MKDIKLVMDRSDYVELNQGIKEGVIHQYQVLYKDWELPLHNSRFEDSTADDKRMEKCKREMWATCKDEDTICIKMAKRDDSIALRQSGRRAFILSGWVPFTGTFVF
jgi:hypothetical protein